MEYEIIKKKILYIKNAISDVDSVFNFFNENSNDLVTDWLPWVEFGGSSNSRYFRDYGYSKSIYSSYVNDFQDNIEYKDTIAILQKTISSIEESWNIYKKQFNVSNPGNKQNDFAILKYHDYNVNSRSSELGPHLDHPDPKNTNEHTMLIYWNDSYEGGELFFPKINEVISPKAGDILIFSSVDPQLIHHTSPVTKGNKVFTLQLWQDGATKGFYKKGHDETQHNSDLIPDLNKIIVCPKCSFWGKNDEFKKL